MDGGGILLFVLREDANNHIVMKTLSPICLLLTTLLMSAPANAESPSRELDVAGAGVKKMEVRHGQIGPRDTILFYAFAKQDAVLQLNIKHDAGKFTLSGKMQLFAEGTGAKEIGKWINNQHSCGLFPEVPQPIATHALPAEACAVIESKLKEGAEVPASPVTGNKFEDYALKIQVSDLKMEGFKLKGFTADTSAFVKVGPAS